LLGAMLMFTLMFTQARGEQQPVAMNIRAPEFELGDKAGEWINSKPLQLKDLRGQVVVVHFWTFG
jgi:peroxiredoxin